MKNAPIIKIECDNRAVVFIIGVCHVSEESRRAVKNLIRSVQPDVVVLELCEGRKAILYEDEGTLRKELGKEGGGWFTLDPVNNLKKLYVFLAKKLGILPGGVRFYPSTPQLRWHYGCGPFPTPGMR